MICNKNIYVLEKADRYTSFTDVILIFNFKIIINILKTKFSTLFNLLRSVVCYQVKNLRFFYIKNCSCAGLAHGIAVAKIINTYYTFRLTNKCSSTTTVFQVHLLVKPFMINDMATASNIKARTTLCTRLPRTPDLLIFLIYGNLFFKSYI